MPTLGTPHRVVNKFREANSPVASMTCEELHRFVQDLSTNLCFVSFFETGPSFRPKSASGNRRPLATCCNAALRLHVRRLSKLARQSGRPIAIDHRTASHHAAGPIASTAHTDPIAPFSKGGAAAAAGYWGREPGARSFAAQNFGALFIRAGARMKSAEPADKPGSVVDSHSSRRRVTATLKQPTRRHRGPRHCLPIWSCSRWGLPCRSVAGLAVRSYRTVSPLPRASCDVVRRSSLCCTFRRLAPPRRYLAPCPVEPGLSSAPFRVTRLPGRLRAGILPLRGECPPKFRVAKLWAPAPRLQYPAAAAAPPLLKGAIASFGLGPAFQPLSHQERGWGEGRDERCDEPPTLRLNQSLRGEALLRRSALALLPSPSPAGRGGGVRVGRALR
jgi:hypothetical protein